MKPYSVIFCGTPDFAAPSLHALIHSGSFQITTVITQPDRPVGRKKILTAPIIKQIAQKHNIPVLQPEKLRIEHLNEIPCDYLIVVAYGQILSKSVLEYPTIAPINVHASLLPRWRGASPIQSCIAHNDPTTGITIQLMTKEMDAGDILAQATYPLNSQSTSQELFVKLAELGAKTLVQTLLNPLKPIPQNTADVTYCTKLERANGMIDHTRLDAQNIERLHRAYYPWPGITLTVGKKEVKIHQCSLNETSDSVALICANNSHLYIQKLQIAGKNVQSAVEVWTQLHV